MAARIDIGGVAVANDAPLALIAGPCALESRAQGVWFREFH